MKNALLQAAAVALFLWAPMAGAAEEQSGSLATRLDEGRKSFAEAASQQGAGNVERAATMFAEGASRYPDMRGLFCYGLAVCYAALGRPGLGCEWLEKAVDAGYWNMTAIEKDPALAKIRKMKRYQDAHERMREMVSKARAANPAVTRFGMKIGSTKAVMLLVHADGGSAEEMLEMVSGEAAGFGIACAAIEGPILVGKHIRMWGDREDTMRRISSGAQIAIREFKGKGLPLFICGHLEGGGYVLHYLLQRPHDLQGGMAINPSVDEYLLSMAEAGVAAPPAAIVEIGPQDKEIHNLRRRYFELLRKNNRMSRLLGAGSLQMALGGTFRWLLAPNAGG